MSKQDGSPLTTGTVHDAVDLGRPRAAEVRSEGGTPATIDSGVERGGGASKAHGVHDTDAFGRFSTVIPPGATLADRYRIDWFIARGGMGEVYAAFDRELGDRIALKTMNSTLAGDPEGLAALKAEVSLSRKVSHTNVCRIHDLGVHSVVGYPSLMFLTMEFVEGESLASRILRDGALPEAEAVQFAGGILAGLAAAHEAGVLHRDLKSDNIMLRKRPGGGVTPVIMDFGLASALSPNSSRISGDQALVGSLGYMAPEQVQGDVLRAVTDVYSLGVILFEMLTGQLPFRASTPALAALKRLHEPAPLVRRIEPNISFEVERIVARALQSKPHDRYRSAAAMLYELEALPYYRRSTPPSAGLTPGAVESVVPPRLSRPPQSAQSERGLIEEFDLALATPQATASSGERLGTASEWRDSTSPGSEAGYARGEMEVTLLSGRDILHLTPGALARRGGFPVIADGTTSGSSLDVSTTQSSSATSQSGEHRSLPTFAATKPPSPQLPRGRLTLMMAAAGVAIGGVLWMMATSDRGAANEPTPVGRVSIGSDAYLPPSPVAIVQSDATSRDQSGEPSDLPRGRVAVAGTKKLELTAAPSSNSVLQPSSDGEARSVAPPGVTAEPVHKVSPAARRRKVVGTAVSVSPVATPVPNALPTTNSGVDFVRPNVGNRPSILYPPELRPVGASSEEKRPPSAGRPSTSPASTRAPDATPR
jgi:serine/threonine protein kinase